MTDTTSVREESLPRPRVRVWWFMFAALAVLIALPIYAVSSLLHIRSSARIMPAVSLEAVAPSSDWRRQVEINIGPTSLGLARLVAAFADLDEMDDIACAALRGIHHVQVSVYQARHPSTKNGRKSFLAGTSARVGESWQRVVGVLDGDDAVAVFIPSDLEASGAIEICVVVCSDDTLVVAATEAELDTLVPVIHQVIAQHHRDW